MSIKDGILDVTVKDIGLMKSEQAGSCTNIAMQLIEAGELDKEEVRSILE